MGRLCLFDSCSTNSCLLKPRDVQLHRFPSDPVMKAKWEQWVREVGGLSFVDFVATKSSQTICTKHFISSDYVRKRLCFQAVPSILPEPLLEELPVPSPEASTKPLPEATTEPLPEATTEPLPEASTEPLPEASIESLPEASIESLPEASTEPSPEASTEPSPEASTEPSPEASTEPSPEASTEPSPEASTEPSPEASTEPSPEASTELLPEASVEASSMGIISSVRSLIIPRSKTSSCVTKTTGKTVVRRSLPTRSQTKTTVKPAKRMIIPSKRSFSPLRLRSSAGESAKSTGDTVPTYTISVVRDQTNAGSVVGSATPPLMYCFSPSNLQNTSIQMAAPVGTLRPLSTPLRSPQIVYARPININKTTEQQTKRIRCVGDILSQGEFQSPGDQIPLNVINSKVTKTKRKLQKMQLKYIRAMRKIKTLENIVAQFKEEESSMDEELQIKVCSSCRKVNLCP